MSCMMYPRATYINSNGNIEELHTYDSCIRVSDALRVIENWDCEFNIKNAWIDVFENGEKVRIIQVKKKWTLSYYAYLKEIEGVNRDIISEKEAMNIILGKEGVNE